MTFMLLSFPVALYLFWAIRAIWALKKTRSQVFRDMNQSFSIIVAFKNEGQNLRKNLDWWKEILNSHEEGELILVDDNSNDSGYEFLKNAIDDERIKLLKSEGHGKKEALRTGISYSKAELLFFTDADCRPKKKWIELLRSRFDNEAIKLVLGPVIYEKESGFSNGYYALDFLSLMISTEAAVLLRKPAMANGASLAVRRDVRNHFEHDLQKNLASGDDVFLLHAVVNEFGANAVRFVPDKPAVVETSPPSSFGHFVRQRLRWGGKSRYYNERNTIILAGIVFLTNLTILISLLIYPVWTILLFLPKLLVDGMLLKIASKRYSDSEVMKWYPIQAILYPFYISLLAIFSQVIVPKWKR